MYEDEYEDEDWNQSLQNSLAAFDKMYAQDNYRYFDSEELEYVLDHFIITNQLNKAKWAVEKAAEHFPKNTNITIRLAQILSLRGDLNKALNILLDLEQLEPYNTTILTNIASCYGRLKNENLAIAYYKKGYDLTASIEEKEEIAVDLALELENKGSYHIAISILIDTIENGQYTEALVYELAHCYKKLNQFDKAIQCYQKFIDVHPYSYMSWYNLGNIYVKLDRLEKAIWAYEYAIVIKEDFIPALDGLAGAYLDVNKVESALECYQKCLQIDKEDPLIHCSLGECFEELDEFEEAYKHYHQSTVLMPRFGMGWLGKGIMNDLLGFHQKAIQELTVAIDIEPDNAEHWKALGNAYENNNEMERALNSYEKAIELSPQNEEIVLDYLAFMATNYTENAIQKMEEDPIFKAHKITQVMLCYSHWVKGNHSESTIIFNNILQNDINLGKKLFLHFPEMNELSPFAALLQEIEEKKNNEEF